MSQQTQAHILKRSVATRKPSRSAVGDAIDRYCRDQGIAFSEFARRAGVHQTLIAHFRSGDKVPGWDAIDRIRNVPGAVEVVEACLYARGIHPAADRLNRAIVAGGPATKQDIIDAVAEYLDTIGAPE